MKGRFALVLNVPDAVRGTWRAEPIGRFRSLERALRRAERLLSRHPVSETRFARERFPFSCSLYDAKRSWVGPRGRGVLVPLSPAQSARLEAPVSIVLSVGELGWTP